MMIIEDEEVSGLHCLKPRISLLAAAMVTIFGWNNKVILKKSLIFFLPKSEHRIPRWSVSIINLSIFSPINPFRCSRRYQQHKHSPMAPVSLLTWFIIPLSCDLRPQVHAGSAVQQLQRRRSVCQPAAWRRYVSVQRATAGASARRTSLWKPVRGERRGVWLRPAGGTHLDTCFSHFTLIGLDFYRLWIFVYCT